MTKQIWTRGARPWTTCASLALLLLLGCGDDGAEPEQDASPGDAAQDAGPQDAGPVTPAPTGHCDYEPVPPTAGAGGTVTAGTVEAGASEERLALPVSSALGAYTARAGIFGDSGAPPVDERIGDVTRAFLPSVGAETFPKARALALTAGDETIVLLKIDVGVSFEGIPLDVADALGADYHGKVIVATSHTHGGWGHYTANSGMQLGFDIFRPELYEDLVDQLARLAQQALDARRPARVGIAHDGDFDPDNRVNRDRRGENDHLPNGADRKDHDLFMIRVDGTDGEPIAALPVVGLHGTLQGADNNMGTTDAPGAIERGLEESFEQPVVVMHLQGAAGDVSPTPGGDIDCDGDRICYSFAKAEGLGRRAVDPLKTAWEAAGADMKDELAMEMVTRSVPLGPDWETFTVRDGSLRYAPWDGETEPDREIFGDGGEVLSPLDEFNAPYGAALCGKENDTLPGAILPDVRGLVPYGSCLPVNRAAEILGPALDLPFEPAPLCASTRTTLSAVRIDDMLIATAPGEPLTLFADALRAASPIAPEKTIVLGYAQGHMGYLLTPEDWLAGGYEPSINFWGPLEGEYLLERSAEVMQLAMTDEREDATAGGTDRWMPPTGPREIGEPDPAPMAGTVPDPVPETVYVRGGEPLPSAQPPATVQRLGLARFAWIGEDPRAGAPTVTLERETAPGSGSFETVTRRSGRPVSDGDILLTWTPDPLGRPDPEGDGTRTHYWAAEWQALVPWGTPGMDAVEDKPGLPLGRYRFHVEGDGYSVSSDPFEVVPATLSVEASVEGTEVVATASYHAPNGWRLLTYDGDSDQPVPLWPGTATVEIDLAGGGSDTFADVTVAEGGQLRVDVGADASDVTAVRVVDRFDNVGEAAP